MDKTYKIYHVTRNLAKHSFELDDALYGSPLEKKQKDWALEKPEKYLADLRAEYNLLESRLDDFVYVLSMNGIEASVEIPEVNEKAADAYIYHRFTDRSFNYLEKIVFQLNGTNSDEINLNVPKAMRQLNAVKAALYDIKVSMIRFEAYTA